MEILEHYHLKVIIPLKIFGFDISITNLVLSMFGATLLFLVLFLAMAIRPKIIPKRGQTVIEIMIDLIKRNMVYNMIGKKEGDNWFPLIAGIFIFVLSNNLVGLIPGAYTPTLNPIVPLTLALIVFIIVQITNFRKNGIKGYARTFAPRSVPAWMYVIVVPIEFISNIFAKPFSLFIRLMANMLAGHTIIYVLLGMILYFQSYYIAIPVVPFVLVMYLFEVFVSAIQAYIFAVLTAMYVGEAVNPRH